MSEAIKLSERITSVSLSAFYILSAIFVGICMSYFLTTWQHRFALDNTLYIVHFRIFLSRNLKRK